MCQFVTENVQSDYNGERIQISDITNALKGPDPEIKLTAFGGHSRHWCPVSDRIIFAFK